MLLAHGAAYVPARRHDEAVLIADDCAPQLKVALLAEPLVGEGVVFVADEEQAVEGSSGYDLAHQLRHHATPALLNCLAGDAHQRARIPDPTTPLLVKLARQLHLDRAG